jgi:hypothetical protein
MRDLAVLDARGWKKHAVVVMRSFFFAMEPSLRTAGSPVIIQPTRL